MIALLERSSPPSGLGPPRLGSQRLRWSDTAAWLVVAVAFSRISESLESTYGMPPLSSLVALGAAVLVLLDPRERRAPHPMLLVGGVAVSLDVAVATWSALGAADPALSIASIDGQLRGVVVLGAVLLLVRTPRRLELAVLGIVAAMAAISAVNLWQAASGSYASTYFGLAFPKLAALGAESGYRLGGPVGDPNFFAQMLAPGVAVAFALALAARSSGRRTLLFCAAALGTAALVLTYSRGGLLALLLALAVVAGRSLRWGALVVALLLSVPAGLFAPKALTERMATAAETAPTALEGSRVQDSAINGRASEALVALELFREHPIIGVGSGNYPVHYLDHARGLGLDRRSEARSAHSLVLETLAETGILGLTTLVVLVGLALLGIRSLRVAAAGRDRTLWWVAVAVEGALVAHLGTALLLHSSYPRGLWLLLGLGLACGQVRPAPEKVEVRT